MRQHPPETLLLRIRAETLWLNLNRAQAAFEDLPSLMGQFKKFADCLSNMHECAGDLYDKVVNFRIVMFRGETLRKEDVKDVQDRLETMAESLESARATLTELRGKSYLVRMRAEEKTTWKSLYKGAVELKEDIKEIEKDLSKPNAWQALSKAEAEANDRVFNESIELLGGIALRDARLDADICALAESLIRSILGSKTHPNVIPGGISSMMMRIERFVRLRFPDWTIWGLPLVAHELWPARAQLDDPPVRSAGADGSDLIKDPTIRQCLGDAYATYFIGPAYAWAAVTLLFDPTRTQDDLRVHATEGMLRLMDPTKAGGFSESYRTVAESLVSVWNAAKHQASTTIDPSKAKLVDEVVAALFGQLAMLRHPYFSMSEWNTARNWAEKLHSAAAVDEIEISGQHDMRHALNAAWLARLDAARTEDISKLTELAYRLAHRVLERPPEGPPEGPRVKLRHLG